MGELLVWLLVDILILVGGGSGEFDMRLGVGEIVRLL